jgi:hypothetical protein
MSTSNLTPELTDDDDNLFIFGGMGANTYGFNPPPSSHQTKNKPAIIYYLNTVLTVTLALFGISDSF